MKAETRRRLDAEKQRELEKIRKEDFIRRARAFRYGVQALSIECGVKLEAFANPSSNVTCEPTIEILQLGPGEVPELIDRDLD